MLGTVIGPEPVRRALLMEAIYRTRQHLQRLRQLPAQHALIMLRLCFGPENMHLLRSMDTSGLEDELHTLDESIYSAMDALRGAPFDAERSPRTTAIYGLPLSMGGLGISSYCTVQPAAWGAARSQSQHFLTQRGVAIAGEPVPDPFDAPAANPEPPRSQRERARAIHSASAMDLLAAMSPEEVTTFVDNGSQLATAWMHTIPRGKFRALTGAQVSAGISIRCQEPDVLGAPHCPHCQAPRTFDHYERCPQRPPLVHRRHNHTRDLVARAIRRAGRHVQVEPAVGQNPQAPNPHGPPVVNNHNYRRADLLVGTPDGGLAMDVAHGLLDIKVKLHSALDTAAVRLAARAEYAARAAATALAHPDDPPPDPFGYVQRAAWAEIQAALHFAHTQCRTEYAPLHLPQAITPVVISTGGTLLRDTAKLFKTLIPEPTHRLQLRKDLSIALLQARAASFNA